MRVIMHFTGLVSRVKQSRTAQVPMVGAAVIDTTASTQMALTVCCIASVGTATSKGQLAHAAVLGVPVLGQKRLMHCVSYMQLLPMEGSCSCGGPKGCGRWGGVLGSRRAMRCTSVQTLFLGNR